MGIGKTVWDWPWKLLMKCGANKRPRIIRRNASPLKKNTDSENRNLHVTITCLPRQNQVREWQRWREGVVATMEFRWLWWEAEGKEHGSDNKELGRDDNNQHRFGMELKKDMEVLLIIDGVWIDYDDQNGDARWGCGLLPLKSSRDGEVWSWQRRDAVSFFFFFFLSR